MEEPANAASAHPMMLARTYKTLLMAMLATCGCSSGDAVGRRVPKSESHPQVPVPDVGVGSSIVACPEPQADDPLNHINLTELGAILSATDTAARAMVISIDGLNAGLLRVRLDQGCLPTFRSLMAGGTSTLNARSDFASTSTLPNHVTMVTGRPVAYDAALPVTVYHGWEANDRADSSMTLHSGGNPRVPYKASLFDVAHDHGKRTCLYADKDRFQILVDSYDEVHGAPDLVGDDNGTNKIDRAFVVDHFPEMLVVTAELDLAADLCDVAFVHIGDLDFMGHDYEWASPAWYQALDRVDAWIARLMRAALLSDANWAVVLTADHGGEAETHENPADPSNYMVPFIALGPLCTPASDAHALSGGTRTDPMALQMSYSDVNQPIRNGDVSNVALGMLGLPAISGSLMRGYLVPQ